MLAEKIWKLLYIEDRVGTGQCWKRERGLISSLGHYGDLLYDFDNLQRQDNQITTHQTQVSSLKNRTVCIIGMGKLRID